MKCKTAFPIIFVSLLIPILAHPAFSARTRFMEETIGPGQIQVKVGVSDLDFEFKAYVDEQNRMLDTFEFQVPHPYRLGKRADIVGLLESGLKEADGHQRAVVFMLSSIMLQHIDDPKATNLYVRLHDFYHEGDWRCTVPADANPDDASSPPIWLKHTGDERVLSSILRTISREEANGSAPAPYSLNLLATTSSPRAQHELRKWYEHHKDKWAWGLTTTLTCGIYPMASENWNYILFDLMPVLAADRHVNDNRYQMLYVWWELCGCDASKRVDGFSWNQIAPLAETYLDNLFNDAAFDRVILGGDHELASKIENLDFLVGYDRYEMLLSVSKCFASQRQVQSFQYALARYEGVLFAPETHIYWPYGRGGSTSGPSYEMAVDSYRDLKEEALEAMRHR